MTNWADYEATYNNIINAAEEIYPTTNEEIYNFHNNFSSQIEDAIKQVYDANVDFDNFCEAQESKGKDPRDVRGFKIRYQRATNPIIQNTAKVYIEQATNAI